MRSLREIRKIYTGRIGYSCEAWNAKNIKFWSDLDFIGVNFYYGYKGSDISEDALRNFYASKLIMHYSMAEKLDKPLILTELGFPSHEEAIRKPHAWPGPGIKEKPDLQTQAYRAMRQAMESVGYPHGMYVWKYVTTLESYERKNYRKGFILQGKPAELEIRKLFMRASTSQRK